MKLTTLQIASMSQTEIDLLTETELLEQIGRNKLPRKLAFFIAAELPLFVYRLDELNLIAN